MRVIIDNLHREYFQNHGLITFEEVFSKETLALIRQEIDAALIKRSKKNHPSPEETYTFGHDLFRDSPRLKKIVNHKLLGQMTSELIEQKPIRLGFDQYIKKELPFPKTLKNICSIQGFLLGVLIPLDQESITFISPETPLPNSVSDCLIVGYIGKDSVYVYNKQDPHTHELKKIGLQFGDRLNHTTHPTIN